MTREQLRKFFIDKNVCIDCQYLDKYLDLIYSNMSQKSIARKTQSHHIIPRNYYELNGLRVDNSKNNLVNLAYKDHVLAHYYLALSSVPKTLYCKANFCAIYIILGHKNFPKSEKDMLSRLDGLELFYEKQQESLSDYNVMKDLLIKDKHDSIMRSEEVKTKISDTVKQLIDNGILFNYQHKKHLSEAALGKKQIHKNNQEKHVDKNELESYLADGWELGSLPISKDHIEKLRQSHFKEVYCIDEFGDEVARFQSVIDADKWWFGHNYVNYYGQPVDDYHKLSDIIKKSAKQDKYICGLKWIYVDKEVIK